MRGLETCPIPKKGQSGDPLGSPLERIFLGLGRFLLLPGIKQVARRVMWILRWVPGVGQRVRVLEVETQITRLEDEEKFEDARALRTTAFERLPSWCLGPVWRSEGEDRLWRLHDYRGALEAFERAMAAVDQSPSMWGVIAPDRMFCGAAVAAVMVGDMCVPDVTTASLATCSTTSDLLLRLPTT